MELNKYQFLANQTDQQPEMEAFEANPKSMMVPLLGMAGEVGELLGEFKKRLRDGDAYRLFPERVKEELGDLLWYLANVASKNALTLEEIALFNLDKTRRRWKTKALHTDRKRLFDEDFPPSERLPRRMDIFIEEGAGMAITRIDGTRFGDPLTDNRYEDDGYRFHDVSHLAYASILGWSPTLRALLRRKRKSDPKVDEVEDGGRAIVIEEGISAMVFSYAERRNFLDGAKGVNYDLLRTIKDMTSHLEVSARTEGDWEKAITTGFDIWRKVKDKGQGRIHADLEKGTILLIE